MIDCAVSFPTRRPSQVPSNFPRLTFRATLPTDRPLTAFLGVCLVSMSPWLISLPSPSFSYFFTRSIRMSRPNYRRRLRALSGGSTPHDLMLVHLMLDSKFLHRYTLTPLRTAVQFTPQHDSQALCPPANSEERSNGRLFGEIQPGKGFMPSELTGELG